MYLNRRKWVLFVAFALFIAVGAAFFFSYSGVLADADHSKDSLRTLLEVISYIKTEYYQDVDAIKLISKYMETGTINAMLRETLDDPYTNHIEGWAWEQMQIDNHGLYGGIGITVGMQDNRLTIVAPFEGTPGFEADLRSGDHIIAIDGRSTEFMSMDEAVSMMRGEEGTSLTLQVQRRNGDLHEAHIVRAIVEVPSVSKVELFDEQTFSNQPYSFGYIRLQRFSDRSDEQIDEALTSLEQQGAVGLILDLRDNPGGVLGGAIDIANRFMPAGHPIVHVVTGKDERRSTTYSTKHGTHPIKPLVILINEYSASASEILAGALQDRGFAVLVGNTTFGKGSVQLVVTLRDGSALKLTQARYETADRRDINKVGIDPDIFVDWPEPEDEDGDFFVIGDEFEDDPQFLKAVETLMEQIELKQFDAQLKKAV